MAKKILGVFLLSLLSVAVFIFFRIGAYKGVEVVRTPMPAYDIYFKVHRGPYHEIINDLKSVESKLDELGQPCKKTFGMFLNDPELVDHKLLLSLVGCAFPEEKNVVVENLPPEIRKKKVGHTKTDCYKGTFKGSPSLTAFKVYPRLKKRALKDRAKLKTESLELYETKEGKMTTEVFLCKGEDVTVKVK